MAEITEAELGPIVGLVARHGYLRKAGGTAEALFAIELDLLRLGFRLTNGAVGAPDPHAPPGGSALALRRAA
jgi:hypothetical protein